MMIFSKNWFRLKITIISLMAVLISQTASIATASESAQQAKQQQCETIADYMAQRDVNGLASLLDMPALLHRAFGDDPSKEIAQAIESLSKSPATMTKNITSAIPPGTLTKCLGVVMMDQHQQAVVRLIYPDEGYGFIGFVFQPTAPYKIKDFYQYAGSEYASIAMGRLVSVMLGDYGSFGRALGLDGISQEELAALNRYMQAFRERDVAAAETSFAQMPDVLQQDQALQLTHLSILPGESEGYQRTLASLHKQYGDDPKVSFMLADYHLMNGNYQQVRKMVGQLPEIIRTNAVMVDYLAVSEMQAKDYAGGIELAQKAIDKEPTWDGAYFTLLDGYVFSQQYVKATQLIEQINQRFDYQISLDALATIGDVSYDLFIASDAAQAWQKRQ